MSAEAERSRAEVQARWPGAPETGRALPWEEARPAEDPPARSPRPLAQASLAALPEALGDLGAIEALDLAHLIGRPPAWLGLRTPLNDLLVLARDEAPSGEPATVLLSEAVVHEGLLYVHRALRVDSEEGVRRHGEWTLPAAPLLLKARAIKADHSLVLPESHGASARQAFPELEVGDLVEVEWVEELAPDRGTQLGERVFSFQDPRYRTARTCFAVAGAPDTRPALAVADGQLWLFEKAGRLPDPKQGPEGTLPYSQWCTRRAPPQPSEPGALMPERSGAHVRVFPVADESAALALAHEDLWRLLRADEAIAEAARALLARHGRRHEALVEEAWRVVAARVHEDLPDAFGGSVAETWRSGRGNRAALLTRLLLEAGVPARLALVNPLARDEGSPGPRFTLAAYPLALVHLPQERGAHAWLDPSSGDEQEAWLASPRRDRPAWLFGFPGVPVRARTPAEVPVPDALRLSLDCDERCRVRLEGSGEHRRWIEQQAPGSDEARGAWLAALVGALLPVEESEEARSWRSEGTRVVEGRVRLRPTADGALRLAPLAYGEALLALVGGTGRRSRLLVDADLDLVVEARLEGYALEAPVAMHERCRFFELRVDARQERGGVVIVQRFSIAPQIVEPDLAEALRQNLTRIARPPAIGLKGPARVP